MGGCFIYVIISFDAPGLRPVEKVRSKILSLVCIILFFVVKDNVVGWISLNFITKIL